MIKKPEQYLEDAINKLHDSDQPWFTDNVYDGGSGPIMEAIRQAQLDAIEETVKLCAHEATVDFYTDDDWERVYFVNKDTILNCATLLKKDLEK